jgi:serine/threonine-protein kinase
MNGDPRTIGRYHILRQLGQGGMGVVYLAEDPLLKRRVAIKVVKGDGEVRQQAMLRFRKEAETSAQLNHPNVVTVFDVGVEPEIGPFLAMEFVEGTALNKHIKAGDLDVETKAKVLIQTSRALRASHRCAIVHRDIKPANIMVSDEGRAKLMDFGIARTFAQIGSHFETGALEASWHERLNQDAAETTALRITSTGDFLGSPAYSAPEMLRGSLGTPSSDRYSFAATAFELMSGKLPHPGKDIAAIITHTLRFPPEIPPDMPPRMARVFRRAREMDPDDRYPTLLDFIEELIDGLEGPTSLRSRLFATLNQEEDVGTAGIVTQRRTQAMQLFEAASAAARPTPPPVRRPTTGSDKIQLAQPLPGPSGGTDTHPSGHHSRISLRGSGKGAAVSPGLWTAVKWTLGLVLALQLFSWVAPRLGWRDRAVSVDSIPSGADVLIDGKFVGRTPLDRVRVDLQARRIKVQKEQYQTKEEAIGTEGNALLIRLEPEPRAYPVVSDPRGASVFLNGVRVGTTPMDALPMTMDGRGELRLMMPGYRSWVGRVEPGQPLPNPIQLQHAEEGNP